MIEFLAYACPTKLGTVQCGATEHFLGRAAAILIGGLGALAGLTLLVLWIAERRKR